MIFMLFPFLARARKNGEGGKEAENNIRPAAAIKKQYSVVSD